MRLLGLYPIQTFEKTAVPRIRTVTMDTVAQSLTGASAQQRSCATTVDLRNVCASVPLDAFLSHLFGFCTATISGQSDDWGDTGEEAWLVNDVHGPDTGSTRDRA